MLQHREALCLERAEGLLYILSRLLANHWFSDDA